MPLALKVQCRDEEKKTMEALLVISLVGWVIVGINLLFTYDKSASADAR